MSSSSNRPGGVLNVRDKETNDKRWWSPDRDITVLYPRVMRWVFHVFSDSSDPSSKHFNPLVPRLLDDFSVADDDVVKVAKTYAKFISCVELRQDTMKAINNLPFMGEPAQAIVALIFLQRMTELFAEKYGATLHKGEDDPNKDNLSELLELLHGFEKPRQLSWWRKLCMRVQLVLRALRCPLLSIGP